MHQALTILVTGSVNMNKILRNLQSNGEDKSKEVIIKQWARQQNRCGSAKKEPQMFAD